MKVAFLGTGLMGLPMAQRLLAANIELIAYNRTPEKLAPLQAAGAAIATKPREAIRSADCIILMLSNAAAIYHVLLTDTSWHTLSGRSIIQMGTTTPQESQEIRNAVVAAGGEYIEAPVLGSIPEAETGKLIVMVGGEEEQYQRHVKLLSNFGPDPVYIGPVGSAASLTLALNQLIASLTTSFALSLAFVQLQGIDVELFMRVLRDSKLYAPIFDQNLNRMLDGNYSKANLPTKQLIKEIDLFISEAKSLGLNLSSIEGVKHILQSAMKMSYPEDDYSSVFPAIREWGEASGE
ncbi:MAG: NAD(P)-dependent oxidoreductase [Sphaerospermopsis kisseleviana]|jgi:3-hydroxyisobutyrate dehydrogenase|uniref:6-phosphogluconate dehydrogenase NAD-binding protein n=2 Tax=Sphaerospermopsis TaxID=752201 RepID=A0A480AB25_9CYAN|nr:MULTISPECIES: NAD(P)-dependent oxidoreductase [Sphaerospermopsis]MEB3151651.1 NAD(P)-dependent oxidoreductase [Sphaerospermopsis sp.]MBC5795586.1 NAD(P)-dependent oxidoreductase [Sphaerospermopsis sp. LEGE 00249]MBD2132653.1 NAD(P)-dependent oxidoreductase [Sphaerospermopsis sp. FACHB-1094]MBD2144125.1 NAD(P)-dependent oxidoreductase [Sphaerospermopsis sp. FACHB-1194]MBE9235143.1 NAD(P)-dependent oxidoreductase [Sphaerospermopsis aphanizomenoides LEGE 00250]